MRSCGAFESLIGLHAACGYEFGLHSAIENHGAIDSSNQCVTSLPGVPTVGAAAFYPQLGFTPTGVSDKNGEVLLALKLPISDSAAVGSASRR